MIRYPGGKSKLRKQIVSELVRIIDGRNIGYCEPFFGGGSIGLKFLQSNYDIKKIWINDIDLGISCLWTAIIKYPELLIKYVKTFKPSIYAFYNFKSELSKKINYFDDSEKNIVEYGFKKLALHQISYSGLGVKSGGPLGGEEQKSKYKIDCRWSLDYICKQIYKYNELFARFNICNNICTQLDFEEIIKTEQEFVIYLDPPYYVKGNDLYQFGFTEKDHIRLANLLKQIKNSWLLSYDDCEEIRQLYSWASIIDIDSVNYSITALKDKNTGERKSRQKRELLIMNNKDIKRGFINV